MTEIIAPRSGTAFPLLRGETLRGLALPSRGGTMRRGGAIDGGRGGLDPNRYGDWEIKGLTADF